MSNIQAQLRASIEADPRITPPPALGPPIIGPDTPGSAPGVNQPQYESGDANTPTAASMFPQAPVGTWMPPPQVGMGGNAPFGTVAIPPAGVPPSVAGVTQPQFQTGSGASPTAASLFPAFTAAGPFQPIVLTSIMNNSPDYNPIAPPFTAGTQPITQSTTPPPVYPGPPTNVFAVEMAAPPMPPPDDDEDDEADDEEGAHVTVRRTTTVKVSKPKGKKKH